MMCSLIKSKIPTVLKLKKHLLASQIRQHLGSRKGLGFFFHATDWQTIGFGMTEVPERTNELIEQLWNHALVIGSEIKYNGETVGANLIATVPPEFWIGNPSSTRRFRNNHYFPGLQLAKDCNLSMVALGALMPYASNYGRAKLEMVEGGNPAITTGHCATVAAIEMTMQKCCLHCNVDYEGADIGIFGAAGMLGSLLTEYLLNVAPPKKLLLFELPKTMESLKKCISKYPKPLRSRVKVIEFRGQEGLPIVDGAILATNQTSPYLSENHLRSAKFWIDDTHPRATSIETERNTQGQTLYVECYLRGPDGLDVGFPFRLPGPRDCYACFAEGYVAWREGITNDFKVGKPSFNDVITVKELLNKHGFKPGPFVAKMGGQLDSGNVD